MVINAYMFNLGKQNETMMDPGMSGDNVMSHWQWDGDPASEGVLRYFISPHPCLDHQCSTYMSYEKSERTQQRSGMNVRFDCVGG